MQWVMDHILWHAVPIVFAWTLWMVWPWIRRPNWPATPEFNVRFGWAILLFALLAALAWVFLFWQAAKAGWI
jgi:hypothetical protein